MTENESVNWIKERIHDRKHFTARYLAVLSEASGIDAELISKGIVATLFLILAICHQAHFFGNFVLVIIPFLLIFAHPEEKPTDESLLVYFSVFGCLTLFDRNLETIPLYYILKLSLFLLLFIPPYRLVDVIDEAIKKQLKELNEKNEKKSRRSTRSTLTAPPRRHNSESEQEQQEPAQQPSGGDGGAEEKVSSARTPEGSEEKTKSAKDPTSITGIEQPTTGPVIKPEHQRLSTVSATDVSIGKSKRLKKGVNPMQDSSFHNLKSDSEGFNSKSIGPANNLHDLFFFPMDCLVFNAPFDYENLTYHMKIVSNCHHRIAYAIKGNAVPRIMAFPPFGILMPKEERLIAVTLQKFEWNPTDYEKDRIAFDYVILPATYKDKEFSMKIFQNSDSKRRKNIKIQYNP